MNMKKLLLTNLPYLLFVYPFDKVTYAFWLTPSADLSGELLSIGDGFAAVFSGMGVSLHPTDQLQHGLYGGNDDPGLPVSQFICQGVKQPARHGFSVCRIPKEELIHEDMIVGHELKKDLEAGMLPLVFNIDEIAGRKIHIIAHFVAGLFLSRPRCFDCCPIRA